MTLIQVLQEAVTQGASDIFLKEANPPWARVGGRMIKIDNCSFTSQQMEEALQEIASERSQQLIEEMGAVDIAFMPGQKEGSHVEGFRTSQDAVSDARNRELRMRVNIFKHMGRLSMVFRHIKSNIPDFDTLNLPSDQLKKLAAKQRGLILITGTAGSGKSTSIASMLEYINQNFEKHIITIEDPIEYVFESKKSLVHQREIGHDTPGYSEALRHVVRESPDIILVGEMRDAETMEAAINAAETGHLVFSTLHTPNAIQTIDRIINFFPPHVHQFLRDQLAMLLEGVVSMRLVPTKDLSMRVPAVEIMAATPTTRELIQKGRTGELYKALEDGKYFGCMLFNQSLMELINKDLITIEDALNSSDRPEDLRLELRGITRVMHK